MLRCSICGVGVEGVRLGGIARWNGEGNHVPSFLGHGGGVRAPHTNAASIEGKLDLVHDPVRLDQNLDDLLVMSNVVPAQCPPLAILEPLLRGQVAVGPSTRRKSPAGYRLPFARLCVTHSIWQFLAELSPPLVQAET